MSGRARQGVGIAPSGGFIGGGGCAGRGSRAPIPRFRAPIGQAASCGVQPACPTVPAGSLPAHGQHFGSGMNGCHHLRPDIRKRCPGRMRPGEVIEIIGRVHRLQHGAADGGWCHDVQPGVPAARQQRLGPRRGLEIRAHPAALQKECRRVAKLKSDSSAWLASAQNAMRTGRGACPERRLPG